jgi:hypothetical protein
MIKTILAAGTIIAATSLAQDATPEQQAEKCAAEGGCIIVTRDGFMAVLQAAAQSGYAKGLKACNSNI